MNSEKYFKPLDENPNYSVSRDGEIKNKHGRMLKPVINQGGYVMVCLSHEGKQKLRSIHRLVAESFIPNPQNKPEVNHIDGDKTNNHVDNLEWVTKHENLQHAYDIGLKRSYLTDDDRRKGARINGEKTKKSILVKETGTIYSSLRECAKHMNCDPGAISKCCNGVHAQHHGYHFEFVDEVR